MTTEIGSEFKEALGAAIAGFGIDPLTQGQARLLIRHYEMLRRWNQRMNLTRIIEPREAAKLHYAESLFGAKFISGTRTVLDIGSGAGFPGIPLAVAMPLAQMTALEANQKKALFLKEAKDALELNNFKVVNARLEEFDCAGYDVLTTRALDRTESILPLVIERMESKQRLLLYCSRDLVERLQMSRRCEVETHSTPLSEQRVIAMIRPK